MSERQGRPAGEFGSADSLYGVPAHQTVRGSTFVGPVFTPIYFVGNTQDKVMIDDLAFVSPKDEHDAAGIMLMRQVDTSLADLVWSRKIGMIPPTGILARRGRVGPFDVLFIGGPTFDQGRRQDDRVVAARRAKGLPTGDPGDRKIIVPDNTQL